MYIKRVIIRGFKTYKNETIIEDLSPHNNIVVGRNGSGKSNFFAAIRFVLSDAYNNMTREERQSLIHESSVNIMSAFVEIIFDNKDRRIPIAKDEISIRRTIGMKKDDYSLDYKSTTKSEIMNLLEASGFSKSNPYYIVPQGKVTALTNAKDSERLELLKDIAGARVFENKLKDSLKEMSITSQKQLQIKDMLLDIEKRLDELNIEKEDLKSFEKLNSKKKILEFNIYDRELKALSDQIDLIEDKYNNTTNETESLINQLENRESEISNCENILNDLNSKEKLIKIDLSINNKENREILQQISNLNVQIKEAKINVESSHSIESYNYKIKKINEEIQEKKNQIINLKENLKKTKLNENEIKIKISDYRQKQTSIIARQNQKSKYSSKSERDKHIKNEINLLNDSTNKKNNTLKECEIEKSEIQKNLESLNIEKSSLNNNNELDNRINQLNDQISILKSEARTLVDDRSVLWRQESKLNSIITSKEESLSSIEQPFKNNIDNGNVSLNALDIVKDIAHNLGPNIENGIYGYLGELIDVSEKYKIAADVIGGNSLFHIVVNNDQTASILIEELKKVKYCRTTFIPLNRLKNEDFQFPQNNESVPLIKKIAFDNFLEPAVKQIFGRTVVCVNIEKGYELANKFHVNSVTLDGDRCDNNGVLTGGFRDNKISKIDYLKNLRNVKSEIYKLKEELNEIKNEINLKDFNINTNFQNSQKLKNELNGLLNDKNEIIAKISKFDNQLSKYNNDLTNIDSKIDSINNSIELIDNKIENYQDELNSSFSQTTISPDEEKLLREIHTQLPKLEKSHQETLKEIDEYEIKISSYLTEISEVLSPRLNQLKSELETMDDIQKDSSYILEDLESTVEKLHERSKELTEFENDLNNQLNEIKENIELNNTRIQELTEAQEQFIKEFEDVGKNTDKNLVQRLRLKNRKHELERNIGELGVLPEDTLTAYADKSTSYLSDKLTKVNENLKKYSHVNKKALEQFAKFAKQRDSLSERLGELDEAKLSIEHLIKVLQNRKNEAIIRSFKELSTGFSKIFEKLVPAGKGKLIILKKNQEKKNNTISLSQYPDTNEGIDSENDESEDDENSIDSFVGISISVSFNSKKNEQQRLEQLSGGQKSLCALSLILAIQSCDPAPFYLFDEIDSNLDAQYRTAVANLIKSLSKDAQFICTTFRSEMLKVSDRFYGVMFNNKVSTISNIDAERALDFVEDQHRA